MCACLVTASPPRPGAAAAPADGPAERERLRLPGWVPDVRSLELQAMDPDLSIARGLALARGAQTVSEHTVEVEASWASASEGCSWPARSPPFTACLSPACACRAVPSSTERHSPSTSHHGNRCCCFTVSVFLQWCGRNWAPCSSSAPAATAG